MANKNITVNGEVMTVDVDILLDLFKYFNVLPENIVTEINGEIISQGTHDVIINDGDSIELVRFVGGG